jgi:hypothetical protein
MTVENKHRADNKTLREFYEATGSKGVLWIDDRTGRIVELPVESRIRRGEGGCQLCHEELDGREAHGEVQFDERGFPRLLFGPGGPICADCVEWVRWLRHYAGREPVSTPRFGEGDLVLRAGTEEIYRILEARLTGLPAAGVWFPVYRCQRIEVRGSSGEILPACLGLEFELADFELQPLPPRYAIGVCGNQPIDAAAEVIDLVGASPRLPTIEYAPNNGRAPSIAQHTRRLLTGKGGGS